MPIENCQIHPSVKIWHPELVNLYECEIDEHTSIGAFVEIGKGVTIGKNCKIQAYAFIPEGVIIGDDVFIGPHACFTNVRYPMTGEGYKKTIVHNKSVIGANATILSGVLIGYKSLVGAGAVVTKDVMGTVMGNPAI